jgi:hypothetical protein
MRTETNTKLTETQLAEIRNVIGRLRTYQQTLGLTDAELLAQFPELGSRRTWRARLLADDWAGLDPQRLYERMHRIGAILDGGLPDTTFCRDLPFARAVASAVSSLERTRTDRRILMVLAPHGTGKTMTARWLVAQDRARRVYCRMRPGWRNRELHIANGIAEALGDPADHPNAASAERRLIALLNSEPRTVFIDQAHEGGPALMHLLRCLVDETPARFVYLGYDTGFRRAQTATTDALIEAQAFLGRCMRPIIDAWRHGVSQKDISAYLVAMAGLQPAAADGLAHRLAGILRRHGNLRLLADAVESCAATGESGSGEAQADLCAAVCRLAGIDPGQLREWEREEEE